MTITNHILFKTVHEDAIRKIREGLATICIDPHTNTIPRQLFASEEDMLDHMADILMTPSELNEILGILARYVGEQRAGFFESGENCVNDGVVYDALCLAEDCTSKPSYEALANMQGTSQDVFCQIHLIESPSEYQVA